MKPNPLSALNHLTVPTVMNACPSLHHSEDRSTSTGRYPRAQGTSSTGTCEAKREPSAAAQGSRPGRAARLLQASLWMNSSCSASSSSRRPHRLPPAPADPGSRSGDLRIVGTALSFPHIHLPETSWFTQVLLYWDSTFALC